MTENTLLIHFTHSEDYQEYGYITEDNENSFTYSPYYENLPAYYSVYVNQLNSLAAALIYRRWGNASLSNDS